MTPSESSLLVLILAAGQGTRMKSSLPKVLTPLCEKPLLQRVVETVLTLQPLSIGIVVGHGASQVKEETFAQAVIATCPESFLGQTKKQSRFRTSRNDTKNVHGQKSQEGFLAPNMVQYIVQQTQAGSGDAAKCAAGWIQSFGASARQVLILCADTPLIQAQTLQALLQAQQNCAAAVLSEQVASPFGYGRILREADGNISKIVEEKDATAEQKQIDEVNSGIYSFDPQALLEALPQLKNDNAKKEFYLTDTISILRAQHKTVHAMRLDTKSGAGQTMGINTKNDLAKAEELLQQEIQSQWMQQGVTILQPSSTYIGQDVVIGAETVILPGTMLLGKTVIAQKCTIGPNSYLQNVEVGQETSVLASFIYDSSIGSHAKVGPFTHIRAGAQIGDQTRIGNFTEIKKSQLGTGSKVSHLSYVGDTTMGQKVNVGAGTITCNYDGKNKFQTEIGDGVFIGSNSNLVAPIKIGPGAVIGAGSTITKDVPEQALAVERSKQVIKNDWAKRRQKS